MEHGKQIVAARCPVCAGHGVQSGMTLVHARALMGSHPLIESIHEPHRDEIALAKLAAWAVRFAPLVAPHPPDGLLFDITGCAHLYGGERGMLDAIANTLHRLGFANRLCCADTIGCAWGVARFGTEDRVVISRRPGSEQAAMLNLPVESLRVDANAAAALHEVNVDRVGDLLAIPRHELAARFSDELFLRIDQALGRTEELIQPIRVSDPIHAERVFDGALVDVNAMLITGRELVEEVAASLLKIESGATRLQLSVQRLGDHANQRISLDLRLSRPSRDSRHLWMLLQPRLETVNMGFGIECMTLTIRSVHRIRCEQSEQWSDGSRASAAIQRDAGELIDTLSHRLGPDRMLRMDIAESHCPERVPVFSSAMAMVEFKTNSSAITENDRPSLLVNPPEAIEVLAIVPEGPPFWLRWRGVEHRILAAHGPQRIESEWWIRDDAGATFRGCGRDYFKVQDACGRWLWIYREAPSGGGGDRWFMHGEWA